MHLPMIGVYNAHFDLRRYFMHTALDHEPKQELYNTYSVAVPPCVTYVHVRTCTCKLVHDMYNTCNTSAYAWIHSCEQINLGSSVGS